MYLHVSMSGNRRLVICHMIENRMLSQMIFWGVWLVIPLLWEILGSAGAAAVIFAKHVKERLSRIKGFLFPPQSFMDAGYCPVVSIIIPVYNSENTLEACLQSIVDQTYPIDRLEVLLVDNGSADRSRIVFERFQSAHRELKLWWHTSEQGKSRALNMGVFSGTGRYIINIDSDGTLDKKAIENIARRFEENERIAAMTGVVLTDHNQIETKPDRLEKSQNLFTDMPEKNESISNEAEKSASISNAAAGYGLLKLVRQCELFEYCESFLIGRSIESIFDHLHTMAGAFSCFRREALIKTQLYNTETMGEDAHMTSQIREFGGGKVVLCEDAFYFTQPIESLDKLYTQRQRWQRAELEVAGMFIKSHTGGIAGFFSKPAMRRIISSHTLAFPRMIWMFAMIYLYFINYPLKLLIGANALLYISYVLVCVANTAAACYYLAEQKQIRGYILRHLYICLFMPLYRFMLYWIRLAGIINSLTTSSRWRTKTFSEEIQEARQEADKEVRKRFGFLHRLNSMINRSKQ